MQYDQALGYLKRLGNEVHSSAFTLKKVHRLCRALGHPEQRFASVLIAGTNGKGSTAATLYSILLQAGIPAGCYTSPHLVTPRERLRVGQDCITEEEFAICLSEVKKQADLLLNKGCLSSPITFFEALTLSAFLFFAEKKASLAVLEVGLGGRLDATNACRAVATAITSISFDHQQFLGRSLLSIAREKSGIYRRGVPVVLGAIQPRVLSWLIRRAARKKAPVILLGSNLRAKAISLSAGESEYQLYSSQNFYEHIRPALSGPKQLNNLGIAVLLSECLNKLGWPIGKEHIRRGVQQTFWPGRLQFIAGQPPLLLDGAHNEESILHLISFLQSRSTDRKRWLIFGAMKDKDILGMGRLLFPWAEKIILTSINNPRSAKVSELMRLFSLQFGAKILTADSPKEALNMAQMQARDADMIVISGSLYLVGEVLGAIGYDPTRSL